MKSQTKWSTTIFLNFLILSTVFSQIDPEIDARLEKRTLTFQEMTLPYRLYIPDNYTPDQAYPLLLFLHGALWAGTDNVTQLDNELALYWMDSLKQTAHPCFIVYPQIPVGASWEKTAGQVEFFPPCPELATAQEIVMSLLQEFSIDDRRLYLCGKSIGALGVYGMLARYPGRYAAAIPAAGNYLYQSVQDLAHISMWIFHNKEDNSVSVNQSRHVVTELEKIGKPFIFTHCNFKMEKCDTLSNDSLLAVINSGATHLYSEFDAVGHQLEPNVVATFGLYEWTMAQEKMDSRVGFDDLQSDAFVLCYNYPNPLNADTILSFELPTDALVHLDIYNTRGEMVASLINGWMSRGQHEIFWHAVDEPSGVYLYKFSAGAGQQTGRCLLLK